MAKKATVKKVAKKGNPQAETETLLQFIGDELNNAQQEFQRFTEKGVKACLGRVRKHLMAIKRAASDARKSCQEVRNNLK